MRLEHTRERLESLPAGSRTVLVGHWPLMRTVLVDGVPHHEASLGYPHEWGRRGARPRPVIRVLDDGTTPR